MELNDLFITITLINSVWLLLNRPDRAWSLKAVLLLAILGVAWKYRPEQAGLIVIGPWIILLLLPIWLRFGSIRLIQQRHLRLAQLVTSLLIVLHPWSGTRTLGKMVRVLRAMLSGDVSRGLELASQYQLRDPALIHLGEVLELQQSGDWLGFENQMLSRIDQGVEDSSLLAGRLMATAHLGRWEEFADLCETVGRSGFSPEQNAGLQLRTWALLGDLPAVQMVLRTSGQLQARENRQFWLAVAEQNSGRIAEGRQRLLSLQGRASPTMRAMIQRQLAGGPIALPDAETTGRRAHAQLQSLESNIRFEERFAVMSGMGRFPIMTVIIALVLVAVFFVEIPGGSEDVYNLERLGALVVPMGNGPYEWTRMLTSGFLHFGPTHLAMNLLGLWILGRIIERAWGRFGVLALFLICVSLSGMLLPSLTFLADGEPVVFAGASGGIMGLLGGVWGNLAVGMFPRTTPRVRQQFRTATTFIGLQALCDSLTPGISMTCHLLGLTTGIVVGVVVGLFRRWSFRK